MVEKMKKVCGFLYIMVCVCVCKRDEWRNLWLNFVGLYVNGLEPFFKAKRK